MKGALFLGFVFLAGALINVADHGWDAIAETWRSLRLPVAVVVVCVALLAIQILRAPSKLRVEAAAAQKAETARKSAAKEAEAERAAAAEFQRRSRLLAQLRQLYVLSHDGLSSEMLAGVDPLPKPWVEKQLAKMGETWRQMSTADVNSATRVHSLGGLGRAQVRLHAARPAATLPRRTLDLRSGVAVTGRERHPGDDDHRPC